MGGRHAAPGKSTFARDLVAMIAGILAVGVVVFGGLWWFMGRDTPAPAATSTTTQVLGTSTTSTTTVASSTTTVASSTTTVSTTTTVRPSGEVSVLVLNAIGVNGLAAQVTEQLAAAGYVTLPPDNYTPSLEQSRIWFREGYGPEALELATLFPDALVELNPDQESGADIVVVLGASYQG